MNYFLLSVSANGDFYEKWADVLENQSIFRSVMRTIGWIIIKGLMYICNACEDLLVTANTAINFITSKGVTNFIKDWRMIIIGILIISIIIFGIAMISNHKQDRSKLFQNIVIAVIVLMGLTTAISQLTTNTSDYVSTLLDFKTSTSAERVLKSSIIDVYYLDAHDFSDEALEKKNGFSASRISNIDPTEDIQSDDDVSNPDIFKNRLKYDDNGTPIIVEIDDGGLVDFNNDTYYRYKIDFITIFVTLLSTAIVMFFISFKVIKIVFDIIVHQILAIIMAAGDWSSGQKLKEVIKSLFALFFSVFMCSVMMKLYFLFSTWTSTNIANGTARALLLLFAAFAVIDGPNIVEKLFGVDAGLSSTFRSVSTLFFASRGLAGMAKGAVGVANSAARGLAHAGGATGGIIGGFRNAYNGYENSGRANNSISDAATQNKGSKSNVGDSSAKTNSNNERSTSHGSKDSKLNNANLNSKINTENKADISGSYNQKDDNLNLNGDTGNSSANDTSSNISSDISKSSKSNNNSIANSASKNGNNSGSNIPTYVERKSRNQYSKVGAGMRGYADGRSIGEKIGNVAARRNEKRNLKGDDN